MTAWTLAGATVVDGTGAEPRTGTSSSRTTASPPSTTAERRGTVIDATGLIAAPGFVDIHSHVDWIVPLDDGPALLAPNLQQGITTAVAGNCGISPAPLGDVFRRSAIERMPVVGLVTDALGWNWRTLGRVPARDRAARDAAEHGDVRGTQHAPGHRCRRGTTGRDAGRAAADDEAARAGNARRCGGAVRRARVLPGPLRRPVGARGTRPRGRGRTTGCSLCTPAVSPSSSTRRCTRRSASRKRVAAGFSSRTSTRWDVRTGTRSTVSSPRSIERGQTGSTSPSTSSATRNGR